jgi:hypothetical protein
MRVILDMAVNHFSDQHDFYKSVKVQVVTPMLSFEYRKTGRT